MGNWGSCDFSALENLSKRMHELASQEEIDAFYIDCLNNMTNGLLEAVKAKTPVESGHLRRWWAATPAKKNGKEYGAELFNDTSYASFVENGHRQEIGRYVPRLGRRLKRGFVDGKFMLRDSAKEAKAAAPAYLERKQREFLRRLEGR